MKIETFFHRIRFFYVDAFWYDGRCWKAFPGSTPNDSKANGLPIFDDMSSFFSKLLATIVANWANKTEIQTFQKMKVDA